jgi:hypothetical protein
LVFRVVVAAFYVLLPSWVLRPWLLLLVPFMGCCARGPAGFVWIALGGGVVSIAARKPVLPVVVVCAVLVGWLVWACVPALAAAPEAPGPVLVGNPGAAKVIVHGVLSPHAEGEPGTYEFLYRASGTNCEGGDHAPTSPGLAAGVEGEEVAQELVGLSPDTEYTVCLLERSLNQGGGEEAVGPAVTFKTVGVLEAPFVSTPAIGITVSSIKLQGVLNPGAPGVPGTYEFVYRRSPSECQRENPETHVQEDEFSAPTETALGGQGEVVPVVPVEASGLAPNTAYTFCLLARNEAGETMVGSPVTFTTLSSKPSVSGETFSKVGAKGATVSAQIETGGLETTFTVQYGTTSAYGSEKVVKLPAGSPTAPVELNGLQPNTEYHFRVLVSNADGSEGGATDIVFRTQPPVTNGLPDDRVYEMVTPPENGNSDVENPSTGGKLNFSQGISSKRPFLVAADGSGVTYETLAIDGAEGNEGSQYLARRSPGGGWAQTSIQPLGHKGTEYQGFSNNLSVGVLDSGNSGESEILPPLTLEAPGEGYKILYESVTSGSEYRSLIPNTVKLNRPVGGEKTKFGSHWVSTGYPAESSAPAFAGGSADFRDLLFEANDALLPGEGALEKELEQDVKSEVAKQMDTNYLYDDVDGKLSLIDVSSEGSVVPNATFGALPFIENRSAEEVRQILIYNPPDFSHVISADGGRVYWTDVTSGVVYLRENGSSTVQVSGGAARYWTASNDGRYALYTEGEGMGKALYRFDAEPEAGHAQREVLTDPNAGVLGVIGASEDGQTVYFVAEGVLSGENSSGVVPLLDKPNLYVLSNGGPPVFIATLSETDGNQVPSFVSDEGINSWGDWQPGFGHRTARVTGDGGSVVFMSNQSLSVTGYPHGYPSNGSDEVYVYEAGSNRLYCASCGSTGEALPGGEGAAAYLPIDWHDTYLPQWISEDGNRVFFDSGEPLVVQDTNGKQDVYEWEREGYGSCLHSAGSTGGCVFLLSGGTSEAASWFVGASANGNDAFIVTRAQLDPEDGNDAFDLYDARVDGVKPFTPPACTGSGCQGVPAPPPVFATPPSVTFNGVGNFALSQERTVKAKAKPLTRAQKLASVLRTCKKRARRKRSSCEKRARKLYGVTGRHGRSLTVTGGKKHA